MTRLLALILLLLGSNTVLASGSCSAGGGQTFVLSFPSSIAVPRDLPNGTLLANWIYSTAATNLWTCTVTADSIGARGQVGPAFTTSSGQNYSGVGSPGGLTYTVYNTNVPGVGIAIAENIYTQNAGWNGWRNVTTAWAGQAYTNVTGTWSGLGIQIAMALVKTGPVTPGVIGASTVVQGAPVSSVTQTGRANNYNITPVTITVLACTTPDVTVPLGTHSPNEMASVGATTLPVSFNISLNSCPAGMNSIQYRIDPVTTVVNSVQSVVALNSGSTASGVAVQMLNSAGTAAFPLSSYQTFSGYSKSTGGTYSIPLNARYYRTGAITPGTANTSMTFTMQYQ